AVLPDRHVQATALGQENRGVDGLSVSFAVRGGRVASRSCGPGCYRAAAAVPPGPLRVLIGGSPAVAFRVPRRSLPASALVARARKAFLALHSVVIQEHLASSPTAKIFTTWRLEAPNRVSYVTSEGARAVVIGSRRWDKTGSGPWRRSSQTPLPQPGPWWGPRWLDAREFGWTRADGRRARLLSFYDPELPAWFEVAVDPRTAVPLQLRMTAAAHFMRHRYLDFNTPRRIRPPA